MACYRFGRSRKSHFQNWRGRKSGVRIRQGAGGWLMARRVFGTTGFAAAILMREAEALIESRTSGPKIGRRAANCFMASLPGRGKISFAVSGGIPSGIIALLSPVPILSQLFVVYFRNHYGNVCRADARGNFPQRWTHSRRSAGSRASAPICSAFTRKLITPGKGALRGKDRNSEPFKTPARRISGPS